MKRLSIMILIIVLSTFALAAGAITSTISQDEITIDDMSVSKTVTISVTNTGAEARTLMNVVYIGFSNSKDTLDQEVFSHVFSDTALDPGETETVTITIDLSKDTSEVYASDYVGTIKVTTDSPDDYAEEQLTIHVTDADPKMSSDPLSFNIVQGNSATLVKTLSNTGNTDITSLTISSSDLSDGTHTLQSSSVVITPNNIPTLDFASSQDISYAVNVPSTQEPGIYSGTITYSSSETTYTQQITVEVIEKVSSISYDNVTLMEGPSEEFSKTITVHNTGNTNLENLQVTMTGLSDYDLVVDPSTFNLNAGQSTNIILRGKFPEDLSTGDKATGTITISNSDVSEERTIEALTIARLRLYDVVFDNDDKDKDMNNGSTYSYLKPGDNLKIQGTVENTYDDDITLEDVEVEITINDIDDGDDLEETASLDDLDEGDDDSFDVSFDIPYEVRDGDEYDVEVIVRAEDENGGSHEKKYEYTLRVDRDSHDIIIKKAVFDNPYPRCGSQTTLTVELMNIGAKDEDDVTLAVSNTELGINERELDISLDSNPNRDDNRYTKTYTIDIPSTAKPKTYLFTIKAYYNTDTLDDQKTIPLEVRPCATTTTTSTTRRATTTSTTTTMAEVTTTTLAQQQKPVVVPEFKSTSKDTLTIALLSAGITIGLVLIILMLYLLIKK